MKKLLFGIFAAATMLFTSCSQDEFDMPVTGDMATVSFSLETPVMGSRAYGDGTTATNLKYAVFDLTDNSKTYLGELSSEDGVDFDGKKMLVPFQLATGHTYGFIFWAGNATATPYTLDLEHGTVSIDYDKVSANDETLDAFYAYKEHTVKGAETIKVDLYRPFTQINFGTNDFEASKAAGYIPTQTQVVVSQAYTGLDLFTGEVDGSVTDVTFAYSKIPEGETFPKTGGYDYLAMVYVLVPAEQSLINTTLYHKDDKEYSLNVSNVPVQRNYRTNLYGALLTDALNVEVEKQPEFGDIDQEVVNVPEGKAVMNGTTYETIEAALAAMQEAGSTEATIYLGSGDYTAPKTSDFGPDVEGTTANVVFKGNGDETVFNVDSARDFGKRKVSLTFESMKIVHADGTGDYIETYGAPWTRINGLTYTKCSVEGSVRLLVNSGKTATFDGCQFNNKSSDGFNAYSINYYAYSGSNVVVNNCTFNSVSRSIVMYNEGVAEFNMTVKGCKFNATDATGKSAIQMHSELGIYGTLTIENTTAVGYNENNEGKGLWSEVDNLKKINNYKFDIYVDGVQVHGSNKVTVNGEEATSLADAVAKAQNGGTIALGYGDYDIKTITSWPENVELNFIGKGKENTRLTQISYVSTQGCDLNFKDLTFDIFINPSIGNSMGFENYKTANYENVRINGEFHTFLGTSTFSNCDFHHAWGSEKNDDRYCLWAETSEKTIVRGCTFDNNYGKGILVYKSDNYEMGDLEVSDCDFKGIIADGKGAIEIHSEKFTKAGTITINRTTCDKTFSNVWREVYNVEGEYPKGTPTSWYTIIVDGETQQTGTPDGKVAE